MARHIERERNSHRGCHSRCGTGIRATDHGSSASHCRSRKPTAEVDRYHDFDDADRPCDWSIVRGLLYGVDEVAPFVLSFVLFLIASINVISIRTARPTAVRQPVTLASVFAGVSFIRSKPVILGTISLDLFAVLLEGATALLPMFARDILHAGPWGLGLLRASPAIGAVVMSIYLARCPLKTDAGRKMLWAVAIFGLATMVFAVSQNIALSIGALFVVGASDTISVVVRSSLVQLLTPDEMRGRVNAVNSLFIGTSGTSLEIQIRHGRGLARAGSDDRGSLAASVRLLSFSLWMIKLFPDLARVKTLSGPEMPTMLKAS